MSTGVPGSGTADSSYNDLEKKFLNLQGVKYPTGKCSVRIPDNARNVPDHKGQSSEKATVEQMFGKYLLVA